MTFDIGKSVFVNYRLPCFTFLIPRSLRLLTACRLT